MRTLRVTLISLMLGLSINSFAGAGKIVDFLVNGSGVIELLAKVNIKGASAQEVKKFVSLSLKSLNVSDSMPSASQLKKIVDSLPASGRDAQIKDQLSKLLAKSGDNPSKDDVVKAVNNLIYLANRYGRTSTAVLGCAKCVSDDLSFHGFRFTMRELSNTNSREVLSRVLPQSPSDVRKYISNKMKSLGLGDFSKISRGTVAPEEERALALMLGLYEAGSAKQKQLISAIIDASKDSSGKVDFLGSSSKNKLYLLFTEEMEDEYMDYWTQTLKKVAKERESGESMKDSFFTVLYKEAGDDPIRKEEVKLLESKKCFFP